MLQRIITSLIIIALVIPPLFFGGVYLRLLIFAICAIASYEMVSLRYKNRWGLVFFTFLSTLVMYLVDIAYYVPLLVFYIIILCLIVIANNDYDINDMCFILLISLILTIAAKGVVNVYEKSMMNMIYIIIACYVTDTMAYFVGYKFGKHKMIPRISPKKTWEGALGGYFFGALISLIYGYFMTGIEFPLLILSSFTLPIIAQIGDLSFSAIKRSYHVKDFGSIFPGHGGVLDRIDSLLFCIISFYAFMILFIG